MHRLLVLVLFLPSGVLGEPSCRPAPPLLPHHPPGWLYLEAERLTAELPHHYHLEGQVGLERDRERLTAPRLDYLPPQGLVEAPQGAHYQSPRFDLQGDHLRWWLRGPRARIDQLHYRLWQSGAIGEARNAHLEGKRLTLNQADYTTCPGERPAWRLRARRLTLDPDRNLGWARDLTLHIGPLPVIWLPYIQFPLGGRKTGLLPPTLDQSAQRGLEYSQPFYLNLAPNRDVTLTLHQMSERGTQWEGEFRYLERHAQGILEAAHLPRDRRTGTSRSRTAWNHRQRLGPWRLELLWRSVSDPDYLKDLGGNLSEVNRPYLERHVRLQGRHGPWRLSALAQDYQRLDPDLSEPYRRLPRIDIQGDGDWWRLTVEHSRFQRGTTLLARRNRLHPSLAPRLTRPYGYLEPRLELRAIHYAAGPSLAIPSIALDGALYFERPGPANETLTPRVFWTYTPYRRQDQLPLLDTSPLPLGTARLFTTARYAGGDRVGDRHSLTLAMDYQRQPATGLRQSLTLAGLLQLAEQRLRLTGEDTPPAGRLEPVVLWRAQTPSAVHLFGELHAPDVGRPPDRARFGVNYAGFAFAGGLDYQHAGDGNDQLQLRLWQRRGPWQWGAASRLDLNGERDLETLAGLGYRSCCWSLALHARRYRIGTAEHPVHRITLTMELDGLGRTGRDLRRRLGL